MHTTIVHVQIKPDRLDAFIEAYDMAEGAAAHKQAGHYQIWRDSVADMMAEARRGDPCQGLFPAA